MFDPYIESLSVFMNISKKHQGTLGTSGRKSSEINQKRLKDLKVLRRSSDLLNKIGQGQLQLIMKHILFYHIVWSSDLNNLMNNPSNSPVISEKKMFR